MQQGIKLTVGLAQMKWFLRVLWFDITHRETNTLSAHRDQQTDTHKKIFINTSCYIHTTATFITLNEFLADTKIYFTEVQTAFQQLFFQQLFFPGRSHVSTDSIQQNKVIPVKHKEY